MTKGLLCMERVLTECVLKECTFRLNDYVRNITYLINWFLNISYWIYWFGSLQHLRVRNIQCWMGDVIFHHDHFTHWTWIFNFLSDKKHIEVSSKFFIYLFTAKIYRRWGADHQLILNVYTLMWLPIDQHWIYISCECSPFSDEIHQHYTWNVTYIKY